MIAGGCHCRKKISQRQGPADIGQLLHFGFDLLEIFFGQRLVA